MSLQAFLYSGSLKVLLGHIVNVLLLEGSDQLGDKLIVLEGVFERLAFVLCLDSVHQVHDDLLLLFITLGLAFPVQSNGNVSEQGVIVDGGRGCSLVALLLKD